MVMCVGIVLFKLICYWQVIVLFKCVLSCHECCRQCRFPNSSLLASCNLYGIISLLL